MNRRTFLSIAAGSPLVFGLRELLAQEPAADPKEVPAWYRAALKRMKETHRYGIVFIIPDDPREREAWGKSLVDRYNEHANFRHEPFGVVVFVCLTRGLAKHLLDGDTADRNVFVLGPDGRTVLRAREDLSSLQDWKPFERAYTDLAYGLRDARLSEQAREIQKLVPEATRKAARDLLGSKDSTQARAVLYETADAYLPWIVNLCREAEGKLPEIAGDRADPPPLRWLIVEHARRQSMLAEDPNLPYGIKSEVISEPDPCPPCGRMMVGPGRARKFLSFFEK
jgi:hypothetical protein